MKISEISDTVKVVTTLGTLVVEATVTTVAVQANTVAVKELTVSLRDQSKRIDGLEKWKIEQEAYDRAVKELAAK